MDDSAVYAILEAVAEIPRGRVASYGQIAALAGMDGRARLVGRILHYAGQYGNYPCHRIVNSSGRTAPGWAMQRELLEAEGVGFLPNGCVDMKAFRWDGN